MGRNGAIAKEFHQLGNGYGRVRRVTQHLVGNVGDVHDLLGQKHAGVDEGTKGIHHLTVM